mgnify:CR=1 FL=1
MKKGIVFVIVILMLGWAVFDFIDWDKDAENVDEVQKVEEDKEEDISEKPEEIKVGLDIGNKAPDFELQTLSGDEVKLSDFQGKRVMINFWATWCPPCRAEMPDMEKFYQDKDIEVLAVNLTESENSLKDVEEFSNEFGLTFPILLDTELVAATLYAIKPIPTTYMVDSNGIIQYRAFGPLNYDLMVQEFEKME